jgi:uncharacterized LabA/DUF88 family protein
MAPVLDALKERGVVVAKFAYANWSRQEAATRQMAENAVQMVQRIPSPRGDKNGADINLALDALEMAFTHNHVSAFAIVSGDSDFIPLVNKLKEYGKTVFVVGGKAFTSTILQQNCHEFISYESLVDDLPRDTKPFRKDKDFKEKDAKPQDFKEGREPREAGAPAREPRDFNKDRGPKQRPAPLELAQAVPLVERALEVLERRGVQPQLGLLKSTMLQLDPAFSEKAYGASSFSDFVEKLKKANLIETRGHGGHYTIERKAGPGGAPLPKREDALPTLREVLENHRLELEDGQTAVNLEGWLTEEFPNFDIKNYGFQGFGEYLNFAQDLFVVRLEQDEEKGTIVSLGAEFYPPAPPPTPEPVAIEEEDDGPQPYVEGQPTMMEPNPPPPKPAPVRKRAPRKTSGDKPARKAPTRRKKD